MQAKSGSMSTVFQGVTIYCRLSSSLTIMSINRNRRGLRELRCLYEEKVVHDSLVNQS